MFTSDVVTRKFSYFFIERLELSLNNSCMCLYTSCPKVDHASEQDNVGRVIDLLVKIMTLAKNVFEKRRLATFNPQEKT